MLLQSPSLAQNLNSFAPQSSLCSKMPSSWIYWSTWAISRIPWDSRIQPDISTELKMGSVLHVHPPPAPQLPRLLSIPNCLESLGLPFPWKPDPPRSHTDSAGLEGLFTASLTPASPFPGTSRPIHVGKGPTSAPGEGPWRAATAGRDGGLQGEAGSRKEGQFPRVER